MREFPITSSSHVYHIDSSGSKSFESDPFYRKLSSANTADTNFHSTRQQTSAQCNNTRAVNYLCTSNGDLTSMHGTYSPIRSNNVTGADSNARDYCGSNRKSLISNGDETSANKRQNGDKNRTNGSYTILDAITNAVAAGNCANTVYPLTDSNSINDFDRNNFDTDELSRRQTSATSAPATSTTLCGNQRNGFRHEPDAPFHHYNYGIENNRAHQFPSLNYKHSYLLWIGTPVAAR